MPSSPHTARIAVSAAFLIHATVSGTWAARLPAIRSSAGLSHGELGTALVGMAVGLLVGTRLAGAPVDRFGSRPVLRAGIPVLCAVLVLPALARSLLALALALFALGVLSGLLDVAMNSQGIEVERRLGRPLLGGLHGLWSIGLGLGAGAAALAAAAGIDPLAQFALVGAALAVASLALLRNLLPAPAPAQRDRPDEAGGAATPWTLALLLLGVIAFCSFFGEGSASDWSAVYLTDELDAGPALAATAFAAFSVAMAAARFATDPLRERFGADLLVRASGLLAACGLAVALLVDEPGAAIAGFALLGAGLAPIVPIAFSAAGAVSRQATGRNVGRVATIGYAGSVTGPIVIGWLSQATSLRLALSLTAVLALVTAAAAGVVRSA